MPVVAINTDIRRKRFRGRKGVSLAVNQFCHKIRKFAVADKHLYNHIFPKHDSCGRIYGFCKGVEPEKL